MAQTAAAQRTYYGTPIDRCAPGSEHKWAMFTAQRWVYGDTIPEVQAAFRAANGMGRRPNGATYA